MDETTGQNNPTSEPGPGDAAHDVVAEIAQRDVHPSPRLLLTDNKKGAARPLFAGPDNGARGRRPVMPAERPRPA